MAFRHRVLSERAEVERMGIYVYVNKLLDRRWTEKDFVGYIYDVSCSCSHERASAPRAHNGELFCSIIIVDPGTPIVLVIMYQSYSFAAQCIDKNDAQDTIIGMTSRVYANSVIITINHQQFMARNQVFCATKIPAQIWGILCGICNTYAVRPLPASAQRDAAGLLTVKIESNNCSRNKPEAIEFCPLSGNDRGVKNFEPYMPSIWITSLKACQKICQPAH